MHASIRFRLAPLGLLALALLLALPGGAGAAPATVTRDTPFDITVSDTCTGEDIHFFGTIHTVDQFSQLANGRLHILHQEVATAVTAVGETSGTVYNPTGQPLINAFNIDTANGAGPAAFTNRQLFVSRGSGDNFVLRESFHAELTPNGDFVVFRDRSDVECRG